MVLAGDLKGGGIVHHGGAHDDVPLRRLEGSDMGVWLQGVSMSYGVY